MKAIKVFVVALLVVSGINASTAQKKVQSFKLVHVIKAPAEKVWAVVGEDYGAIANSHPKIVRSDYV